MRSLFSGRFKLAILLITMCIGCIKVVGVPQRQSLKSSSGLSIASRFTPCRPMIDGNIDTLQEWADATVLDISKTFGTLFSQDTFPPGSVHLYLMNDSVCVYFAVSSKLDSTLDNGDAITLFFDDNHDEAYPDWPDSSEGELVVCYTNDTTRVEFGHITSSMQREMEALVEEVRTMSEPRMLLLALGCVKLPQPIDVEFRRTSIDGAAGCLFRTLGFELALPLGTSPEYLHVHAGDTVGFSMAVHSPDWACYGWWPADAYDVHSPRQMGDLVLGTAK